MRINHANFKIYNVLNAHPQNVTNTISRPRDDPICKNVGCWNIVTLIRHVSFVDCTGDYIIMSTMLTGAAVMDASLLLNASNMPFQ